MLRGALPGHVREHPRVAAALAGLCALQLAALDWWEGGAGGAAPRGAPDAASVELMDRAASERHAAAYGVAADGHARRIAAELRAERVREQQRRGDLFGDDGLSLRDHVEAEAAERDLAFLPRAGARADGLPVFTVGPVGGPGVVLRFDRRCVFVHDAGSWTPVTVAEVFNRAERLRAARGRTAGGSGVGATRRAPA